MTVAENKTSIDDIQARLEALEKQLSNSVPAGDSELREILVDFLGIVIRSWVTSHQPYSNYNLHQLPPLYERLTEGK